MRLLIFFNPYSRICSFKLLCEREGERSINARKKETSISRLPHGSQLESKPTT